MTCRSGIIREAEPSVVETTDTNARSLGHPAVAFAGAPSFTGFAKGGE